GGLGMDLRLAGPLNLDFQGAVTQFPIADGVHVVPNFAADVSLVAGLRLTVLASSMGQGHVALRGGYHNFFQSSRVGFEGEAGYELGLGRTVSVGLFLRAVVVPDSGDNRTTDSYIVAGLAISLGFGWPSA